MASNANSRPHVVLVPGYWLGAWAWDQVVADLQAVGLPVTAVTLPGLNRQDPDRTNKTLQDQSDALRAVVAAADGDVVLVGHSGANAPVSLVLDTHPELIRRVIWVDSGPMPDGGAFAPDLPDEVTELPLPEFDELAREAGLEGLTDGQLATFRAHAVAEPAAVARATVTLTNPRRHNVPTSLICCSLPTSQVLELAKAGHPMFSAVNDLTDVEAIDLPTGHWPMWSRPKDLADAIATAARPTH